MNNNKTKPEDDINDRAPKKIKTEETNEKNEKIKIEKKK